MTLFTVGYQAVNYKRWEKRMNEGFQRLLVQLIFAGFSTSLTIPVSNGRTINKSACWNRKINE
jgi:hypothetical protein